MKRILAITFDGVLQPIGYSQVARVVMGLAQSGVSYALVSLERARDLADRTRFEQLRRRLDDVGVLWEPETFEEGGDARAIVRNLRRAYTAATRIARRQPLRLVHARAVPGGLVARALRASRRLPYLFDARAYWVDEQIEEGRRFTSPGAYRAAKAVERELFSRAVGIVTLTELQADDVRSGALGPFRDRPIEVIPTCADYDEFRIGGTPPPELLAFANGDPRNAPSGPR